MATTKIKSSDGEQYTAPNTALQKSGTFRDMLAFGGEESDYEVLTIDRINSKYLGPILRYLEKSIVPECKDNGEIFHLLVHCDYLCIPELFLNLCQKLVCNVAKENNLIGFEFPGLITEQKCHIPSCTSIVARLKVCSKCCATKYCSRDCQEADWPLHKKACNAIYAKIKKVRKLAGALENADFYGNGPANLFEENVGHFWGIRETRDYCTARAYLAGLISNFADEKKFSYIYEISLGHYMDLLRLIHGDNMGLRFIVPFIFLKLNRDEECYNYIKWWLTIDPNGVYDWGNAPESNPGDWLYLKDQDIFEDHTQYLSEYSSLKFSVAFMCIKMRIIAKFKLMNLIEETVDATISEEGLSLSPFSSDILPTSKNLLFHKTSSPHCTLEKQLEMLQSLLTIVNNDNKCFLPAVLNPDPLLSNDPPSAISFGSPEEAYETLQSSLEIIKSIPGCMDAIKAVVGKNTDYDATFRS